jgi:hypothetical protein
MIERAGLIDSSIAQVYCGFFTISMVSLPDGGSNYAIIA